MIKRVFIDVETTGTDPKIHAIHQVSGCIEIDGVIKEYFDYNVRPFDGAVIDSKALEVGNVTFEQVMQYKYSDEEAYCMLLRLFKKYVNPFNKKDKFSFVGYNAHFDKQFMYELWVRNADNYFFSMIWSNHLDVMVLASEALEEIRPTMVDFKLMTVARELGIEIDENKLHNSLYDIEITYEMFQRLRKSNIVIEKITNNTTIAAVINSATGPKEPIINLNPNPIRNIISEKIKSEFLKPSIMKTGEFDIKIGFGKYIGKTIRDILEIDPKYILWINENQIQGMTFSDNVIEKAELNIETKENELK